MQRKHCQFKAKKTLFIYKIAILYTHLLHVVTHKGAKCRIFTRERESRLSRVISLITSIHIMFMFRKAIRSPHLPLTHGDGQGKLKTVSELSRSMYEYLR